VVDPAEPTGLPLSAVNSFLACGSFLNCLVSARDAEVA
jgi:hypothetical protein